MRKVNNVISIAFAATLLFVFSKPAIFSRAARESQQTSAVDDGLRAITLDFGLRDQQPRSWSGSVSISSGTIVKLRGYHFGAGDKIIGDHSWEAATKPWPEVWTFVPTETGRSDETRVQTVGLTIYYRAAEDALLRIKLKEAVKLVATSAQQLAPEVKMTTDEFELRVADVPHTGRLLILEGRVSAFRVPIVEQITTEDYKNDYPSIALDNQGNLWVAWVAYGNQGDEIFLRKLSHGSWSEPLKVTDKPGDLFSTAVVVDQRDAVWVIWSEHKGSDWHLMARTYDGKDWSKSQQLTMGPGNDLFHRAVADGSGNIHVVWQAFRRNRSDIFLKSFNGNSWSEETNLSDETRDPRANDWRPAVTVDRSGTVWVAWDTYAKGSYNVVLRSVRNGRIGELLPVTTSARFHANASVATDDKDRVWVAYDEAEENWGKDTGFLLGADGPGLLRSRKIRFAVWAPGRWLEPRSDLNQALDSSVIQSPQLIADKNGHMWVIFLPRTYASIRVTRLAFQGRWELRGSYYSADRWSSLLTIPETAGRNDAPFSVLADAEGKVWVAGVTDHRVANYLMQDNKSDIVVARLPATPLEHPMDLGLRGSEAPTRSPGEPREREQLAEIRGYTVHIAQKSYKIYRGDMHRHTEISGDGAGDGSLWDAYRYALDAANLDYFLITDHNSGEHKEYPWWRIEKSEDMFHVPGFFTTLFGYERGIPYPNGHRNVVFAHRGVRTLPIPQDENSGKISSGTILYPYLRKNDGIAMSHTPSTNFMGTDWRDNDPELEPLVEIFQGARYSAEHEGAPLSVTGRSDVQFGDAGGFQPHGTVWKAWAKGYKLGVQASSDHISTHISYACLLAENGSREALLDAIRRRHSYAATSNIITDFRLRDGSDEYLMGDDISIRNQPELVIKITGTAPIRKVDIIRNQQYIYSREGTGERIEFVYRDTSLTRGEHYYYVRIIQQDGNVAWASPIWVKF